MRKIVLTIFITTILMVIPFVVNAQAVPKYTTLAPIGKFVDTTVDTNNLTGYLNSMFKLGIALAGALAVIMIIIGGIQYMSTDAIGAKSEGRKRITAAVTGLIVALGSYMILNTLNPDLLKTSLSLNNVEIGALMPGYPGYPYNPGDPNYGTVVGPDGQPYAGTHGGDPTSYPGYGGGRDAPNIGAISSNTQAGVTFPNESWNNYALQQIRASGLANLTPTDAATYFPNGVSDQAWLNFITALSIPESGWDPNKSYTESNGINSVGLLSLSYTDLGGRYTEQQLKDPYTNLNAGIEIMTNLVKSGGCISCRNASGNWSGAAAYWSPLRNPAPGG